MFHFKLCILLYWKLICLGRFKFTDFPQIILLVYFSLFIIFIWLGFMNFLHKPLWNLLKFTAHSLFCERLDNIYRIFLFLFLNLSKCHFLCQKSTWIDFASNPVFLKFVLKAVHFYTVLILLHCSLYFYVCQLFVF